MNICSDRKTKCIAGIMCPHARPHHKIDKCSHTRFHCGKFPDKQHRCKKFKPVRSNFTVDAKFDTFNVIGIVLDLELLRLIEKYGTRAKGYSAESILVSLPIWLFEAFVLGTI